MIKTIYTKDIKIKLCNPPALSYILVDGDMLPVSRVSVVADVNSKMLKIEMDMYAENLEIETEEGQEVKLNIVDLAKERHEFSLKNTK